MMENTGAQVWVCFQKVPITAKKQTKKQTKTNKQTNKTNKQKKTNKQTKKNKKQTMQTLLLSNILVISATNQVLIEDIIYNHSMR